jgi:transposase
LKFADVNYWQYTISMTLTIEQRDRLRDILPRYEPKPTGRKRADLIQVLEAILWGLESGARWEDIDKRKYGVSYQSCHRYFQEWSQSGVFEKALSELIRNAEDNVYSKTSVLRRVRKFLHEPKRP